MTRHHFYGAAALVLAASGCFDLDQSKYLFTLDAGPGRAPGCTRACTTPPLARCLNGTTLEAFPSQGQCSAVSGCAYSPVDVRCGSACQDGVCVGEPCAGVFCDAPPVPRCDDSAHLRIFEASTGRCSQGSCTYQPTVVDCPGGCANGVCTGNLCAGVTCDSPAPPQCLDAHSVRRFVSPGQCTAGSCTYASADESCANGCSNGACVGDACGGVVCNQAPADRCVDVKTRRTFAATGVCSGGACTYAPSDQPCGANETCTSGRCVDATGCTATTCSGGCCEANSCVGSAEQTNARCGLGGGLCGSCGEGLRCVSGSCVPSCSVNNGGCSPNATCVESNGSRSCTCKTGYSGDGVTCTAAAADAGTGCSGCVAPRMCVGGACVDPPDGGLLTGERCDLPIQLTNGVKLDLDSSLFADDSSLAGTCSPLNAGNDVVFSVVVPGNGSTTVTVTPAPGLDTSISVSSTASCRDCLQAASTGGPGVVDTLVITNDGSSTPVVWLVTVDSAAPGGGRFSITATDSAVVPCDATTCPTGCCADKQCRPGNDNDRGCGQGGASCAYCQYPTQSCRDQACVSVSGNTGTPCRSASECYVPLAGSAECKVDWPNGGYCTSSCLGVGLSCGGLSGPGPCTKNLTCLLKCPGAGTGQSTCANGYLCDFSDPTNTGSQGVCVPNCHLAACAFLSGSCQPNGTCR